MSDHIHLIGIGGSGMSAIARVLLGRGVTVSGSDQQAGPLTAALTAAGASIFIGHAAEHIAGATVVVRSSAVPDSNPEVAAALQAGLPVLKRSDFLGDLMQGQVGIAVAGTHGKTTTTGWISQLLLETDQDPSFIIGGVLPQSGVNGRAGHGPHFVIEADEYDHMFLGLRPTIAVITNIEHDHPDIFPDEVSYFEAYHRFTNLLALSDGEQRGTLIACTDDPGVCQLLAEREQQNGPEINIFGYGIQPRPTSIRLDHYLQATTYAPNTLGGSDIEIEHDGVQLGSVQTAISGRHNLQNGLAVMAAGLSANLSFAEIATGLDAFTGIGRRFEIKGVVDGVTIIDDYAHHPTEIEVNLVTAKNRFPHGRVWAVWQPHTFSRLKLYYAAFQRCFDAADAVIVLDVYRSRDREDYGLSAAAFAPTIKHKNVIQIGPFAEAAHYLMQHLQPEDVVLIMNAGDATLLGDMLVEKLSKCRMTSDE